MPWQDEADQFLLLMIITEGLQAGQLIVLPGQETMMMLKILITEDQGPGYLLLKMVNQVVVAPEAILTIHQVQGQRTKALLLIEDRAMVTTQPRVVANHTTAKTVVAGPEVTTVPLLVPVGQVTIPPLVDRGQTTVATPAPAEAEVPGILQVALLPEAEVVPAVAAAEAEEVVIR